MKQVNRPSRGMIAIVGVVVLTFALSACGPGTPGPAGPPSELPGGVEVAAKEALSDHIGVPVEDIQVAEAEQRDWPDACLGLAEEGEACAQVITPGWEITLQAGGEEYTLRTDETADVIRLEE
ncbi:MAG: hypothetical protein U9R72_06335 [Chloroflexota bacterium]|nr:hypothetical protein [Chloroflexota bacterium]